MKTVKGKYNEAIVYTDVAEDMALQQIKQLCDMEFAADARIRIMPDVHAGAGCTIGTTMTIHDRILLGWISDAGWRQSVSGSAGST